VDCASLPEHLLESELFGHEKGAFTGAVSMRRGLFEEADGGTSFLDEVGDIPLQLQAKLLRVLQERQVRRVGGNRFIDVDVRVISATHQNLTDMVQEGRFREDLYYRLNVISLPLPPLRDRPGDIPLLAYHFLRKYAAQSGKEIKGISPETLELLEAYPWAGNVRELQNVLERAVVLAEGEMVAPAELPANLRLPQKVPAAMVADHLSLKKAKRQWVEAFEREYLIALLGEHLTSGQDCRGRSKDHPPSHQTLPDRLCLARIIHERSVFVNNAPAGAGSAAPAGFDRPLPRLAQG
jgi:transcriptional regulator with PAS, ATPase and Fis domain